MKVLLVFISATIFFSSCCVEKKMGTARFVLEDFRTKQDAERQKIERITSAANLKLRQGKIDANIQERIEKRLGKFQQDMVVPQEYAKTLDSLLLNNKAFRKNYKNLVLPLLDSLQRQIAGYAGKLKLYLMIEEGVDIADYKLFDLAAFFGPGKYEIPDDKSEMAVASFSPIIDSVVTFASKHNLPGTASLVIVGFADGTGFSNSGPVFETLTGYIGKTEVTKEELNQALSELRAKALIKQLTKAFISKASLSQSIGNIHVEYIGQGKGETYPLPTIKDYTLDDARRRIVLCYWAVLPD